MSKRWIRPLKRMGEDPKKRKLTKTKVTVTVITWTIWAIIGFIAVTLWLLVIQLD